MGTFPQPSFDCPVTALRGALEHAFDKACPQKIMHYTKKHCLQGKQVDACKFRARTGMPR